MESLPGEKTLVKRILGGDDRAFEVLMRHYEPYLLGLLWRMTGDRALAEDLCQEAFIKVLRGLPSFRGESSLKTWMTRIAHNVFLDRRRAAPPETGEETDLEPPSTAPNPFRVVETAELRQLLDGAMEALPPSQRKVLHLYYWGSLSVEEIARALDLPEGTVKTLLFRGRRALRGAVLGRLGGAV